MSSCKSGKVSTAWLKLLEETVGETWLAAMFRRLVGFERRPTSMRFVGSQEVSDRMTYLEQICCCDLKLFGLPKCLSNYQVNLPNDSRSVL